MLHLDKIKAQNFKNYSHYALEFSSKMNGISGQNGAGKTNLLDAIYLLSLTRSYFGHSDTEIVKENEDFYTLDASYSKDSELLSLKCAYGQGRKKSFTLNDVKYKRLSEHIGLLPIVMVAPDDLKLIKGHSEDRRKLLDQHLSQADTDYLEKLLSYNRTLKQRNAALKSMAEARRYDEALILSYDEILYPAGKLIHEKRKALILEMESYFQKYYQTISSDNESVSCDYKSSLNEADFKELLIKNRERDRILCRTSVGPHKDDLLFKINDKAAKKFGSQGQQKSYLLSIKLALYELMHKSMGVYPLLLLDDIFDRLDRQRVENLIHCITQNNIGQIFISDTDTDRMLKIFSTFTSDYKVFRIEAGEATEMEL